MKMDIEKLLRNINSLNEYITVTQESSQICKKSKIELTLSTAHALKKIRSFEIEHVNKCDESGIACIIFERILCMPPSKTWRILSKELVILLQYWLDAVRKHLVKHSAHWWTFLKLLLKFIKEIGQKHSSVPNLLVEHTSECLLDLATNDKPDAMQKFEMLHCFNIYCSESSKELRFTMRNKFLDYFTKLGAYMCNCGHLPTQYSIIETLLRWLLPRKDAALRIASATKWFPARLYADEVVDIFLTRPWTSFLQDARDMLNKHNASGELITSVVCRKLSVGDIVIIPNSDEVESWLDINSASRSLSVLLGPRALDKFGCPYHKSFEMFYITVDNTHSANLYRESRRLVLTVQTLSPPLIMPSGIKLADDVSCDVTYVVTSRDVDRLHRALQNIFNDKYQMLAGLEKEPSPPAAQHDVPPIITEEQKKKIESMLNNLRRQLTQSHADETEDYKQNKESEELAGSSHQASARPAKDTGYKTLRLRQPLSCMSPSTASTSSLAQLHEKLAALPRHKFDKETEWTCVAPDLSVVTEVSEPDDLSTSTIEYKAYGVLSRNKNSLNCSRRSQRSQSDNEITRRYPKPGKKGKSRPLSPIVNYNTGGSLLAATIEVAEDSVISDTAENILKANDLDTVNVDLLYQEAIQASQEKNKDKNDSGINTQEKKCPDVSENCDMIENTIENTPKEQLNCQPKKKSKVIFSTSDESNTEAISDTPNVYVTTRRSKKVKTKTNTVDSQSFDVQLVEEFFSQHLNENKSDNFISPTDARKLNQTSSEGSYDLHNVEPYNFNNFEVLECLNNIVDKVCDDFDKCTKYLNTEKGAVADDNNSDLEDNIPLKDIINKIHNIDTSKKSTKTSPSPKIIKLKYKFVPKKSKSKVPTMKQKKKFEIQNTSKISTIIEDNAEEAEINIPKVSDGNVDENKKDCSPKYTNEPTTPMLRRKRKLFSPKDEQIPEETVALTQPEENQFTDSKIKKTPKSKATYKPYKEIEKERKKMRTSRNRKSKNIEVQSPRSKKMNDLFNKVKESANGEEVILANNQTRLDVYNFSTDSEDDFKAKKIDIGKMTSTTTLESVDSTVLRRGKVIKKVNNSNLNTGKNTKRQGNKRQNTKKKINIDSEHSLVDERMRENKEAFNTSIVIENPKVVVSEPEFVLEKPSQMEIIKGEEKSNDTKQKTRRVRKNKVVESDKVVKKALNIISNDDNNRTESPLPCLVVEETPTTKKEDADLSANMVDKFKKICQNPERYINESNTTQNLLSDNDRNLYSPQTIEITDELVQVEPQINEKIKSVQKVTKPKKVNSIKGNKSTKRQPRNVTKRHSPKKCVEVSNDITSETKSDQSIATAGITGHGDSDEHPPSPKSIIKTLQHRHLESEYLDDSMKDYFDKLTEEINDIDDICRNDTNEHDKTSVTNKTKDVEIIEKSLKSIESPKYVKSPVVSIERLSLEDISRWLPSRRNSESDYNSPSSNKSKAKSKDVYSRKVDSPKIIETEHKSSDDDPEIQEAITRSLLLAYTKSPVFKINNSGSSKKSQKINYDSDDSVKSVKTPRIAVKVKNIEKSCRILPPRKAKCNNKSIISPIKMFDDLVSNADKHSQGTLSDDEEYMNEIKETLYKQFQKAKEYKELSAKETEYDKRNVQQNQSKAAENIKVRSIDSESRDDSRMLKRCSTEDRDSRKKKRVEDKNNTRDGISASGATVTSVDDWFKRSEAGSSRAEDLNVLTKDSIQAVIEKLDTTLIEIHQNTSNKFVRLFVWAQRRLRELRRERRRRRRGVAAAALAALLAAIDDNFAELDTRSLTARYYSDCSCGRSGGAGAAAWRPPRSPRS